MSKIITRRTCLDLTGNKRMCVACQEIYPLTVDFFHLDPGNPKGFKLRCKKCRNLSYRKKVSKASLMEALAKIDKKELTALEWSQIFQDFFK